MKRILLFAALLLVPIALVCDSRGSNVRDGFLHVTPKVENTNADQPATGSTGAAVVGEIISPANCLPISPPPQLAPATELTARTALACTPIAMKGRVVDSAHSPISGATVSVSGRTTQTSADGSFELTNLPRTNALFTVTKSGFHDRVEAVELYRPVSEGRVDLGAITLEAASSTTLLFSGDFSMGRRFLDPDESTPRGQLPPDDPTALIQVSDPKTGSLAAVQYVAPLFASADFRVVNLETPVTRNLSAPHPTKDYAFFTLPESLVALQKLGVGFVSLGNNHVYDYQSPGLADTLANVTNAGLGRSGAGVDPDSAMAPWRTTLGGTDLSFISATSITGIEQAVTYVAGADKGGAADLSDDARFSSVMSAEQSAGRVPIALLHMGIEYSDSVQDYSLSRVRLAIDSGAQLVVAHHPHTAQGFGYYQDRLFAQSLGNFVFDQDRVETMLGLLLRLQLENGAFQRPHIAGVYVEDYRPRPVTGSLADYLVRRSAQGSAAQGATIVFDGVSEGAVVPWNSRPAQIERNVDVTVNVPSSGIAVIDTRTLRKPGEWISHASSANAVLKLGRDTLEHGDFEDHDVDDDVGETSRWELSGSSYACADGAHSGVAALCLASAASGAPVATASFRNRVRVLGDALNLPNKNISLVGWTRGVNAGASQITVSYYASEGDAEFGGETALQQSGTYDWSPFVRDLSMPADPQYPSPLNAARALRVFLQQSPPSSGNGVFAADDLAVVAWSDASADSPAPGPHPQDFIRVEATPGPRVVHVTFASYAAQP